MDIKELETIKQKIVPVLKKHKVSKAGIFGSFARGEQNKKSDIDILIEIDKNVGLVEFIKLKLLLQGILRKKIDLVEYDTIRSEIKEKIIRDEISIL
jgi:uncharacterized protein